MPTNTPTNVQVLTEIQSGPLSAEIAPLWSPVTDNTDAAVARVLNRKDQPGYIPPRDVIAYLCETFKWGMVPYCFVMGKMPDGSTAPFNVYALFSILHLVGYGNVNPPLHLQIGPLKVALASLVAATLITQADSDAIVALEIKISRAEQAWGYDTVISQTQIGLIRTGGN